MFRYVAVERLGEELRRLRSVDERMGISGLGPHFEAVERDGWLVRNSEIYHLFERDGELRGYFGLVPLTAASYSEFLAGERYPFGGLCAGDIVPLRDYAGARERGLHALVESYSYLDGDAARALSERLFGYLAVTNLRGLLATSSRPEDEEVCRWWGLEERYERGACATGTRKLWYADPDLLERGPGVLGQPVPLRSLFLNVRHRFAPRDVLALSPAQRRVARLFYLEEKSEREIARLLDIKPDTVKTHLKRIREKAGPVVGSSLSRRITAWLHAHPGELLDDCL